MQPASIHFHIHKAISSVPFSCVLLVFVVAFPTDELVALLVRLCLIVLVVLVSRRDLCHSSAMLLIGWLFLSVLWSSSPSTSLAASFQFCSYCLFYLVFRYQAVHEKVMYRGLQLLTGITILLSVYGVYQLLYGYDAYFYTIEHAAEALLPASRTTTLAWINALSGRVFSRFALPSQFAGYLLMMFPLQGVLILHERRTLLKILWGMGLSLNMLMFWYTKSFGAWLALFALVGFGLILFLLQRRQLTWRTVCIGSLALLLLVSGAVYSIGVLRGQHLWDFQGNNPLWYRLLNWKVAISMWRDHLFLGTGLSTFGLLYPQYMVPGANESNYVHNSYLQIGVEHGISGLLLTVWLIFAWGRMTLTMLRKGLAQPGKSSPPGATSRRFFTDIRYACAFGGLAFLLHNIVDFDLYVFPLGAVGIALLALTMNSGSHPQPPRQQSQKFGWKFACIGCGLLVAGVLDWQQTEANRQYTAAGVHVQAQRYDKAAEASRKALQSWPTQSTYYALAGSIALFQHSPDRAEDYFQTAVQAYPNTPWFHAGLAEAYLADYNLGLAYAEIRRAAELFPQKPEYGERTQEIQNAFSAF